VYRYTLPCRDVPLVPAGMSFTYEVCQEVKAASVAPDMSRLRDARGARPFILVHWRIG